MKILITGSSGFVGTHLVNKLSESNQIIRYDLDDGRDVLNSELLSQKLKGVDLVIHLAAFISAEESWNKPDEYFKNNALGTLSVARCSIKSGVKKIIFFSSAAVKATPLTPYAVSKIAAENILNLYKDKINVVILRPENIYGSGQKEAYGYVIHNFIKAVKSGTKIIIYGNGSQSRDFVYIDDVTSVVENFLERKIDSGSVINLGTGKSTRIIDLARKVMKTLGKHVDIRLLEKRLEPVKSVADTDLMTDIGIDFKNFVSLEEGIRELLKLQYN